MDNIRKSFSRMKKDLKHRLKGKEREPDRTGANVAEERVDSSDLLSRPEYRVAAGGHDGEGGRISTDARQLRSRARSPQPEPALAGGSDDDGKRREEEIGGKEVSQRHLPLDSNAEFVVNSGPSHEVGQVHPSPPTPSIQPTGGPDSTQTFSFQLLYLTVPSTSQPPLPFPIVCQKTIPTKVLNQTLPVRRNRTGSLPCPPLPNCFSGG